MNSGARRTIGSRAFSVFRVFSARIRWRTVSIDGAKPWNDANGWMDGWIRGNRNNMRVARAIPLDLFHRRNFPPLYQVSSPLLLSLPSLSRVFKTRPDVFGLFRSCTRCVSRSTDVTVGGGSALISRNEWDK